jgi:multiple sugar transport system permease protein
MATTSVGTTERTRPRLFRRTSVRRRVGDVFALLAASAVAVLFLIPFLSMVSTSLKTMPEVYQVPGSILPQVFKWSNYVDAWRALPFNEFFLNSIIVSVTVTVGVIATSSMAGYSFARLRYRGRDKIFLAYLGTIMIPFPVLMIPLFIIMRNLHLVDTLGAIILPALFTPVGTFMMRQFILSLPRELEEAARIDGCGFFAIYWRIVLPLMKPVIVTLGIFTFLSSWNDFLWPLITINNVDSKTLPLGMTMFFTRVAGQTPWNQVMAAATFSVIPVLVLFILGQRYYVKGLAPSGIKG